MRKKYNIKTLPSFFRDLDDILNYITNELYNSIAAHQLLKELDSKLKVISIFPKIFEKYSPKTNRNYIYYKVNIKNYCIFYTIHGNTVALRRLLYSKRNFESLIN